MVKSKPGIKIQDQANGNTEQKEGGGGGEKKCGRLAGGEVTRKQNCEYCRRTMDQICLCWCRLGPEGPCVSNLLFVGSACCQIFCVTFTFV